MTFIEAVLAGKSTEAEVDDWVDRWHDGPSEMELHQWLGMTREEYGNWASAPDALPHIVAIRRMMGAARMELTHAVAKLSGRMN